MTQALQNQIDRIYRRILMNVAPARILATDDTGPIHRVQVNLNGGPEIIDQLPVMQFYGLNAHAPVGSDAAAMFIAGQRSNAVIVGTNNQKARLRNLEAGEVALYTDEGDNLTFGRNQAAQLTAGNSFGVTTKAATIKGSDTVTLDSPISSVTAKLVLAHDPQAPMEACTKQYADSLATGGGEPGPPGPQGPAGEAATIAVGTTTTGTPGTPANVVNVGTPSAAIFDFTIPQGIQGVAGATGATGSPGAAASIAVGTTTTGAPGTQASATNTGSSAAAVFNFTIPRGDVGATGSPGAPGAAGTAATIAVGTTTTGAPGSNASVTNSGNSTAAVFNFTIPRGDVGATGAQGATGNTGAPGAAGTAATIAVGTTTTGAAGSSASVVNVGSSSAAVFNFTIPQGIQGATGATGPQGPPGTVPTITLTGDTTGSSSTGTIATTTGAVNGKTYPTTLISGGVLYASSTAAVGCSAALTANALLCGAGAGAAPRASTYYSNNSGSTVLFGNFNAAPPSSTPLPGVQLIGANSTSAGFLADTFLGTPSFVGRAAGGTQAAPAVTPANQNLAYLTGRGYNGTAYSGDVGYVLIRASETWSATAYGTKLAFVITPATTTGAVTAMQIGSGTTNAAGGVTIGNPTSGDTGLGTLNVQNAIWCNGTIQANVNGRIVSQHASQPSFCCYVTGQYGWTMDVDNIASGNYLRWSQSDGYGNPVSPKMWIDAGGNLTTVGTLTQNSDRAGKHAIERWSPGLEVVMALRPSSYERLIDDVPDRMRHVGLIADELADLLPEAVHDEPITAVELMPLICALINAVQELALR